MIAGTCGSGFVSEVVCLDPEDAEFLVHDPFVVNALGPSVGPWLYGKMLQSWLFENLPRFDVVIIHGMWQYHGYAVRKALKRLLRNGRAAPRCFVMPHGMLDPYFQRDPSRRTKAIRNWIYWKLVEGEVVNRADGLLFTCVEEMLLARQTFRSYRVTNERVVGLGVEEPPPYLPAMGSAFRLQCPELHDRPYLLFLSRIHPKKGVNLLVKAYVQLMQEHLGSKSFSTCDHSLTIPDLVIAGPLDSDYAAEVQQLAIQLLSSSLQTQNRDPKIPSIHFPGMLRGDAKWGAFYGCEAFVLPSHQENFGIAVVEALACGKPVLISDKVNIWREIVDGGGGFAAVDDAESTLALLRRHLDLNTEARVDMGGRALDCFRKNFQVSAAAARMAKALAAC